MLLTGSCFSTCVLKMSMNESNISFHIVFFIFLREQDLLNLETESSLCFFGYRENKNLLPAQNFGRDM